jgi:hypothetical protein
MTSAELLASTPPEPCAAYSGDTSYVPSAALYDLTPDGHFTRVREGHARD